VPETPILQAGLEWMSHFEIELGPIVSLGQTPWGVRRVIGVTGGRFDGPALKGAIMPGGADWQVVHEDGMISVDARYTLETHDGATIYATSRGIRHGSPEVLERLGRGERVDPAEYYFRASIVLEAGAPDYLWVNRRLFVCSAARWPSGVSYDLYGVT
jgi:hypothetical protein